MPDLIDVECIFRKAYHEKNRYVTVALYRPPSSSVDVSDSGKLYMSEHIKPSDRIIISGDFNLPTVNWATMSLNNDNDSLGDAMLDIAFSFNLSSLVDTSTGKQGDCESILDVFFVSEKGRSQSACDIFACTSDHEAVVLTVIGTGMTIVTLKVSRTSPELMMFSL